MGSSPGRAAIFSFPVTFGGQIHKGSNYSEVILFTAAGLQCCALRNIFPYIIIVLIIVSGPLG